MGYFKSATSAVYGFTGYTSKGGGLDTPGVGAGISFIWANYVGDMGSLESERYGSRAQPDPVSVQSDIMNGDGSPILEPNFVLEVARWYAAEHTYGVLTRYYTEKGLWPQ